MNAITFNLSKIMKAAHTIRVKDGVNMSQALRKAWAWAKRKAAQYLASKAGITCKVIDFVDESEQAVKVQLEAHHTFMTARQREYRAGKAYTAYVWLPKSQVIAQTANSITIPEWLYANKGKEMERLITGEFNYDNIRPATI